MSKTFYYFAYGSNLLARRIHINNPTARRKCIGQLMNYRLDFNYFSKRWGGNAATIVPDQGKHVWGAVWEIEDINMKDLDRQEGVQQGIYKIVKVKVQSNSGEEVECRSYQLCTLPSPSSPPEDRLPSKIYLDVILEGAKESNLPTEYIEELRLFKHNNFEGPVDHTV